MPPCIVTHKILKVDIILQCYTIIQYSMHKLNPRVVVVKVEGL